MAVTHKNNSKIMMSRKRMITRQELFEKKKEFHRKQARLPFEEKIRILIRLQRIASSIKIKALSGKNSGWRY